VLWRRLAASPSVAPVPFERRAAVMLLRFD
jgi:hypothetical protein